MQPQLFKNNFVQNFITSVQEGGSYEEPYKPDFRVSSLPFCPLLYALDNKKYDPKKLELVEFKNSFFTDQGHAIHSLWQKVSANMFPGEVIGDWQCNRVLDTKDLDKKQSVTRCNRKLSFVSAKEMQKVKCPHGKKDCHIKNIYSELDFEWFGLEGHTDELIREKYKRKYRYHVVDWKTTGIYLFDETKKALNTGYYPNKKYLEQIETYCCLLEKKYKIKIYSYTIVYVSRERPAPKGKKKSNYLFSYKFTNAIRQHRLAKMKVYRSRFNLARKVVKDPTSRNIKKLYEARPCQTQAQYSLNMAHKFFTRCDYAGRDTYKSCFNGTMLNVLKKELK